MEDNTKIALTTQQKKLIAEFKELLEKMEKENIGIVGELNYYANEDYGTASVRAITNSINQLKTLYSNHGQTLSTDHAYLKTGATFSIGYENELYPIFTLKMANTIVDDAIKHNYGMVSMWSMGRDAMLKENQAITTPFNYSNVLQRYDEDIK